MSRSFQLQIPVLIGENYRHLMGDATVYEEQGAVQVSLVFLASGNDVKDLLEILESGEPQALKFTSIPVTAHVARPRKEIT